MLKINQSPVNRSLSVGFNLKFTNGWTVSVQFGPFTHSANKHEDYAELIGGSHRRAGHVRMDVAPEVKCIDAEVAAWDQEERWYDFGDDTVRGYLSSDEVSDFIHKIRNLEENYNETIK